MTLREGFLGCFFSCLVGCLVVLLFSCLVVYLFGRLLLRFNYVCRLAVI